MVGRVVYDNEMGGCKGVPRVFNLVTDVGRLRRLKRPRPSQRKTSFNSKLFWVGIKIGGGGAQGVI